MGASGRFTGDPGADLVLGRAAPAPIDDETIA